MIVSKTEVKWLKQKVNISESSLFTLCLFNWCVL